MAGDPMDSLLMSLIEKEIPDGRAALIQSHNNLAELSAYCTENYISSSDKSKALQETKEFASQSLASVAYQIHSLAVNILQMMDQQTIQLQKMQSNANNIGLLVDIHKEKVARREIGVLTSSKNFSRSHKVVPPAQPEKLKKYKREDIDYTALDHIGHGVKSERKDDVSSQRRFSTSSSSGSLKENSTSSVHSSSQGSLQGLQSSLYHASSSERKAQFGNTMPPPPRPPIAPVAPFKPKATYTASAPVASGPVMAPPSPSTSIPAAPPTPSSVMPPPPPPPVNVPEPDYDDMDTKNLPAPPPPPPPEDFYQVPPNNTPATPVDDLPPPPPDNLYEMVGGENHYESVTTTVLPPPPPMLTPEGHIIPDTYEEKVVAIYDYQKLRDDELELTEGDVIYVIKKNDDGWFEGIKDGIQGLFPGNYVTPYM